jgi:hypothetical protein
MTTAPRLGDWCQTFTGRKFYPLDPRPEDVCIEDIAHALACQNRFAGHTSSPYSVAEHSVRCARYVRARYGASYPGERPARSEMAEVLAALLHDASEAYLVDVPRPVKHSPLLRGYRDAEQTMQSMLNLWAGLPADSDRWALVKEADEVLLATEVRDLMAPPPQPWALSHAPLPTVIVPWGWRTAEVRFLALYAELTKGA